MTISQQKTQRDNNKRIQDVNVVKNNFMESIDLNFKQEVETISKRKRGATAHNKSKHRKDKSMEYSKNIYKKQKSHFQSQATAQYESDIDPLLAAKIVKEYLLPMFKKRQPLNSSEKKADRNLMHLLKDAKSGSELYTIAQDSLPDTVFGQLKLSDLLYQRIGKLEIEDHEK